MPCAASASSSTVCTIEAGQEPLEAVDLRTMAFGARGIGGRALAALEPFPEDEARDRHLGDVVIEEPPGIVAGCGRAPPSVHVRAIITWLAIFPLVAIGMILIGPVSESWHPVLRAFALTVVVVPLAVYVVVPRLLGAYAAMRRRNARSRADRAAQEAQGPH